MSAEWPHLDDEPDAAPKRVKMISEIGMYPKGWIQRFDALQTMQSLPDNVFTYPAHHYDIPEVRELPQAQPPDLYDW